MMVLFGGCGVGVSVGFSVGTDVGAAVGFWLALSWHLGLELFENY